MKDSSASGRRAQVLQAKDGCSTMTKIQQADPTQMTLGFGVVDDEGGSVAKKKASRSRKSKSGSKASSRTKEKRTQSESKPRAVRKKGVVRATAESMAKQQRDISVSEFFAKNRHLLGFDNKRKALLMSVKEAVDNALDACEESEQLPEIVVKLTQVSEDRFRIMIKDNGPGIVKNQIPNIFGKLLYGSKFHRLKMSRGQQGIGISAAGMYGLLTTGKSIKITSRTSPKKDAHYYEIQIDTKKNAPNIVKDEPVQVEWETGTCVEIEMVASYNKGRQSVDEYIEQTAIANPHARIEYHPPTGDPVAYERGTEVLPEQTDAIRPHPYGVELGMLIKMLHETKSHWLSGFLQTEFCRVGPKVAEQICKKAKLNTRSHPRRIARQEAEKLFKAIQETKLRSPPTNCLAPIGAEQILTGMLKGVEAEFFTAATRPPSVYRGNPFQMEVGLAYGGSLGPDPKLAGSDDEEEGRGRRGKRARKNGKKSGSRNVAMTRVIRFANRVPLLYQQSACAVFKSVIDMDWRRYGLSQSTGALPQAPLVVMVHMASVWVPFTSESKEAIADYDEIRQEIRLGLQECGRKLAAYLNRRRKQKYEGERRSVFERYIAEVVSACKVIDDKIDDRVLAEDLNALAHQITAKADEDPDGGGKRKRQKARQKDEENEFGSNTVVRDLHSEGNDQPFRLIAS
jgi:DNA topoisomerase-6 subunit B